MKKKIFAATTLLVMSVVFVYAQSGITSEKRTVEAFSSISSCCGIDVYITEGNSKVLNVEVNHEDLLSALKTEVRNGELRISYSDKVFKRPRNTKMKIYLEATNLTSISCSSGSNIIGQSMINAANISLSASSGANINLNLNAQKINCDSSSGSNINLSGKAINVALDSSSGSGINLGDMTVKTAKASASSGSNITVKATKEITASASSGSNIVYSGDPEKVNTSKSSGGSVHKK